MISEEERTKISGNIRRVPEKIADLGRARNATGFPSLTRDRLIVRGE